jgi:hypothetical protein
MAINKELTDEKLGLIGLRGIVVHTGEPEAGEYAFYPDNKNESWRQRGVLLGDVAQTRGFTPELVELLVANGVAVAILQRSESGKTVFLNLDAFRGLGREEALPPAVDRSSVPAEEAAILIREDEKYYFVPYAALTYLLPRDAGEAKIVVRRGAVAAAIPNNGLPLGTNCVLINLTQLVGP